MNKETIIELNQLYDYHSYPPQVYEDLIINRKKVRNRLEIIGAWKGNCLRQDPEGTAFVDSNLKKYSFTKRWNYHSPVSRYAWEEVSKIEFEVESEIPFIFPKKEPKVMQDLKNFKGFDFVLSTFILHSCRPEIYPLYDQHVYRSFIFLKKHTKKRINMASKRWCEYYEFAEYIKELERETKLSYWKIDRGLWVFGKNLKQGTNKRIIPNNNKLIKKSETNDSNWLRMRTLGKGNEFSWQLSGNYSINIRRNGSSIIEEVTESILDSLFRQFAHKGWFALANSVTKTKERTEKEGVGSFLVEYWNYDQTQQQLSSQLSAIFVNSGLWLHNGKRRNMLFNIIVHKWKTALKEYFEKELNTL